MATSTVFITHSTIDKYNNPQGLDKPARATTTTKKKEIIIITKKKLKFKQYKASRARIHRSGHSEARKKPQFNSVQFSLFALIHTMLIYKNGKKGKKKKEQRKSSYMCTRY